MCLEQAASQVSEFGGEILIVNKKKPVKKSKQLAAAKLEKKVQPLLKVLRPAG